MRLHASPSLALALSSAFSLLSQSSGVYGVRVCGSETVASSYQWRIGDARYDGADPARGSNGTATVAVSIVPSTVNTFFECVAQWPEAWEGWYEGGSNIIWSDCVWTGSGPSYDMTVSFAMDWKTKTFYFSHTFVCSGAQNKTDALATGVVPLDLDCTADTDGIKHCTPRTAVGARTAINVTTKQSQPRIDNSTASACADNAQRYQSWQLEKWQRSYEMAPAEAQSGSAVAPAADTGPSFTLRSMANSDVFSCATAGKGVNGTLDGTCKSAGSGDGSSTAKFSFDPKLDMLTITQHWSCSGASSFDAVGVAYVQATCDRAGNTLNCSSDPVWIGTKTLS